jgi:hypothetical protein
MPKHRREDRPELRELRTLIKAGVDDLEKGHFVEVDDCALDSFLEGLIKAPSKDER